jgi:hypothetical protein
MKLDCWGSGGKPTHAVETAGNDCGRHTPATNKKTAPEGAAEVWGGNVKQRREHRRLHVEHWAFRPRVKNTLSRAQHNAPLKIRDIAIIVAAGADK